MFVPTTALAVLRRAGRDEVSSAQAAAGYREQSRQQRGTTRHAEGILQGYTYISMKVHGTYLYWICWNYARYS